MREVEEKLFSSGTDKWWDAAGPFRLLHAVNPLRLQFASDAAGGLSGKRLADIGCGGGIFTEAAARSGAQALGADVSPGAISAAREHAALEGLDIEYIVADSAEVARGRTGRFAVVSCFEMLEHCDTPASVVADAAAMLAPGGVAVFSTVNRNILASALMIGALERALKMLPRGAHDPRMFVRPSELAAMCRDAGLKVRDIVGMRYSVLQRRFIIDRNNASVNYFLAASREV